MRQAAIFLHGTIGAGKTTLGRGLAAALDGVFTDGDLFQRPGVPWYASSLTVARGMAGAALEPPGPAVLAYPLRCVDHLYLRGACREARVRAVFVNLHAPLDVLLDPARGRVFSDWERARTAEMIAQGYADRGWANLRLDTSGPAEESLGALVAAVDALLRRRSSSSPPLGR